jgi:hypothetical protein
MPLTFTRVMPRRETAHGASHQYVIDGVTEWESVDWTLTVLDVAGDTAVDCEFAATADEARMMADIHEALTDPATWGGLTRLSAAAAIARAATAARQYAPDGSVQ